jgi:hypothetical protein
MNVKEEEKQEEASVAVPPHKEQEKIATEEENQDEGVDAVEVLDVIDGQENGDVENADAGNGGKESSQKVHMKVSADAPWSERMWEVFSTFWPLGLIAFGGPQVCFATEIILYL